MTPRSPINDLIYGSIANVKLFCNVLAPHASFSKCAYLAYFSLCQFAHSMSRALLFFHSKIAIGMSNIFALSGVLKVRKAVVRSLAVNVVYLFPEWALSYKFTCYQPMYKKSFPLSVIKKSYSFIANAIISLDNAALAFFGTGFYSSQITNGVLATRAFNWLPYFFHRLTIIYTVRPIVQVTI